MSTSSGQYQSGQSQSSFGQWQTGQFQSPFAQFQSQGSGMQLRIRHTTGFTYSEPAAASYNEARMTPATTTDQFVLRSRLEVHPTAWSQEYRDYWGTVVSAFEVHEPHEELTVVSTSTVETTPHPVESARVGWDALPAVADELCEYLDLSDWVRPADDLVARIEPLRRRECETPGDYARSVFELVHQQLRYLQGSTEVTTTAREAWEAGAGVCQDVAHTTIGALRHAGVPARYVSGYLHPSIDPVVGEPVQGESHAWVEYWDGDWRAYDPTNAVDIGPRHVVVARGRDYADNPPLRGIYATPGESELFVSVEITRTR